MASTKKHVTFVNKEGEGFGLNVASFVREKAPDFVPRFNTGGRGENDSDLLQYKTISFSGGMFQREHKEDNKVQFLKGYYDNFTDRLYTSIYPYNIPTGAAYTGTAQSFTAKATNHNGGYFAVRENVTNKLYSINTNGTVTNIALPAAVSGASVAITDLILHKNYLYVCGQPSATFFNNHRYNISAGTWQDIGGGITKWAVLRGILYGIAYTSDMFSCTNEEAAGAATYTLIKRIGPTYNDLPDKMVEFNGAIWVAKPSGLYRFDGVDYVKVLNLNAKFLTVFNGAMYFFSAFSLNLYRFDGSTIEHLQDFSAHVDTNSNATYAIDMAATDQHLHILTDFYDTTGFYSAVVNNYNVYQYDGTRFQLGTSMPFNTSFGGTVYDDATMIFTIGRDLFVCTEASASVTWKICRFAFGSYKSTPSTTTDLLVVTSDIDCDYSSIWKRLYGLKFNVTGLAATSTATVYMERYNGTTWGSRQTLGSFTGSQLDASNGYKLQHISPYTLRSFDTEFKKIRIYVKFSLVTSDNIIFESLVMEYLTTPKTRYRWSISAPVTANQNTVGSPDSVVERQASTIEFLSRTPDYMYLLGPDYATLGVAANDSTTTFTLSGQLPWPNLGSLSYATDYLRELYPMLFIEKEDDYGEFEILSINSYDVNSTPGTITVSARGVWSNPGSRPLGTRVYLGYRVVCTGFRERFDLDQNKIDNDFTHSEIERVADLEFTQVD